MTKPTSETVQAIKSELAFYNERLKALNSARDEVTEAMKALGCQADQTASVINALTTALDHLEEYEKEYPEDDPDDLDHSPVVDLPLKEHVNRFITAKHQPPHMKDMDL